MKIVADGGIDPMNEERLEAYRNLIDALLNCNEGEEWELLQAHQELLDSDFIEVMAQVAEELEKKGDKEGADFLQNLAYTLVSPSAYQGIIAQLLNCASNEEAWQILDVNRNWVDAGLQQMMLEVAEDLRTQGDLDKSNFLMNVVEQLMGVHANTSDAQFDFLMQVLKTTAESKHDPQQVYPLLKKNIDKLDARLAEQLRAWATTTLEKAKPDEAQGIAAVIVLFSNIISEFPLGKKASNMEIAITGYEIALTVFTPEAFPQDWAMTQNNLGIAYCDRIKEDKAENLELAITCYQDALKVYTFDAFPQNSAMTQNNLGIAYCDRIKEDKAENLELAIACYRESLNVFTADAFPYEWARTQNNLASAYGQRIREDKAENLELAIAICQNTLKVFTPNAFPLDWAGTQNNLASAYRTRIRGDKAENLELAITCFQNTLKVYDFDTFPQDWAETQNNLGLAYLDRIRGDKADNLERAISCFQNTLKVYDFDAFPQNWAWTKNNLGNAYHQRIRGDKADNLERAISCFQNALEVHTFDAFPQDWAMTQNNLGNAYRQRIRGDKADNLERAISCYQEALKVRNFDSFPHEWAQTKTNLGKAYLQRIREDKANNFKRAIAAYKKALTVRTREAFPQSYAETLWVLGIAYQETNQLASAYNTFKYAIATVESLREEIVSGEESKRKQAEEWNALYRLMVEVCLKLGKRTEAIEYVERSKTRNLVEQILSHDLKTIFPADVVTQLEQYRDEIAVGQYQIQNGKAENPTALAQHLQQLRQQQNELENCYLPIGSGFQFEHFQNNLDDHAAIVEFYITGNKLLTFIFTHQTQQPIVRQSKPKDLEKLVKWLKGYLLAY